MDRRRFFTAAGSTVARPATAGNSAPVRYNFVDHPPTSGNFAYYVVPYATGEGEGAAPSNQVSVQLAAGFNDTAPPVWDGTPGITAVTANGDYTVQVKFGTATDSALAPAPASPPVTYTVYYSTQTPLNFDIAARVGGMPVSCIAF